MEKKKLKKQKKVEMKSQDEIEKALKDMKTRRTSYILDMASMPKAGEVVYNTDLIRKLEVTDATIHTLRWVLNQ